MKKNIRSKMIFSYLLIALITVIVVSLLVRWNSGQSLMNMVVEQQTANMKEAVQTYYEENGTLDGFFDRYVRNGFDSGLPVPEAANSDSDVDAQMKPVIKPQNNPQNLLDIRGLHGLVDAQNQALIPTMGYEPGEIVPENMMKDAVPVEYDGEIIAWILPDTQFKFKLNNEEQLYLERTTRAIIFAGIIGVCLAILMGFLFSKRILGPVQRLTKASKALAAGNLDQTVPVTSEDEIGQLTQTFNQMSTDLVRADLQRKRLTADITHDLSTPIQIISGYIEMAEDEGVEINSNRLQIIKSELQRLKRLVDDLTTLSQVEAGGLDFQFERIRPAEMLERVYQTYLPILKKQNIRFVYDVSEDCPDILADEDRMIQVLHNLIENALRYTPENGTISLKAYFDEFVRIEVRDSGAGIDSEDLPYVFDRFYRADKSRNVNNGKMGLGLAICKALIIAQKGKISAESEGIGKGTTFLILFPPYNGME
ncbi:MAG TPA: ATP-binding protein [Flexilinea sp.]|nr:ATP-binding protein [Flexilinea sp.]